MKRAKMFPHPAPFDQALDQRLRWMVKVRWLAGLGILATVMLADRIAGVSYHKPPLYGVVVFIFLYNLAIDFTLHRRGREWDSRRLLIDANVQIGLDFLVLVLLVAFTGGVLNLFIFYVVFHIAIGSILLPPRNMLVVSALICLACLTLFWADFADLIPAYFGLEGFLPDEVRHNRTYVFGLSYIFVTMVGVTAYMGATIGWNLRAAEKRLLLLTSEIDRRRESCEAVNQEMLETEKARNDLLAKAADSVRVPLKEIRKICDDYLNDGHQWIPSGDMENLFKVRDDAEIILDLIEDMAENARLDMLERGPLSKEVDLAALCRAVALRIQPHAAMRDIKLKIEIAANVPKVSGDYWSLFRAVGNVLDNAIRYSDPDSDVLFKLTRDWQGEWISVEVSDEGVGIPAEEKDKIYRPFYRLEEAAAYSPGAGMGLAIAQRAAKLHGGRIEFSSRPGKGSLFKILIPVRKNNSH